MQNNSLDAQVLIVGAGPAGATTAFFLARAGVDVLMIDRAAFPREKPCGDSISPPAVAVLDKMGLLTWVKEKGFAAQNGMFFSSPNLTTARVYPTKTSPYSAYLIPRTEFDLALVQRAQQAGARLRTGVDVRRLERLSDGTALLYGKQAQAEVKISGRLVIAADGGHSSFTRSLGMVPGEADAIAVRRYYEGVQGETGVLELHWEKSVLPAYGYIFHMGNGIANVGSGMFSAEFKRIKPNLHRLLDTFIANNPYAQKALANARPLSRAHGMPFRDDAQNVNPVADNVMLVGEAAGAGNPMSAEGIGPAMINAEFAAEYAAQALRAGDVSAAGLAGYARRFHQQFDDFHRAALLARSALTIPAAVNIAIRAAGKNAQVGALLHDVLLGIQSPAEMLKPGTALKVLFP
jgi:geranylgeranyl reductase family protein